MGLGFFAIIVSFIAQRIFIENLTLEYLGINGLFVNIISMLAIAELGLGSAIVYHLYRPIADKDTEKINSLMRFYKVGYRLIAAIVLVVGLCIMPFLPSIAGRHTVALGLYPIFLLFLADTIFSYLMSYKRSILYADQKNYIINIVRIGSLIVLNLLQIIILILTHNYFLYLIIKIVMTVIENLTLNYIIHKKYPVIQYGSKAGPVDDATKKDIYKKVRGLLYHKGGTFFVLGTDNVIISIFLGIKTVGLYSNYLLITMAINTMVSQISTAIVASIGNLLLEDDKPKHYKVYQNVYFANFVVSSIATIIFFVVTDSFIRLWIGDKFVLPFGVLAALSFSLYLGLVRSPMNSFKTAAGIFHEDRYMPIIESVINLVFSIVLLHFFGLAGVFMGTALSALFLHLYAYPKYTYGPLFARGRRGYYTEFAKYLLLATAVGIVTFVLSRLVTLESNFLELLSDGAIALVVPIMLFYLVFRKTSEYAYFTNLGANILQKTLKTYVRVKDRK